MNLFIDEKKTKIEYLFLLIVIIPFIKTNSIMKCRINNKNFFSIFGNNFGSKIKDNIIIIQNVDFENRNRLINLLNYEWEIIPSKKIINILRFIINHYYDDSCLNTFENALNFNFEKYIKNNENNLSFEKKKDLFSKK